MRLVAKAIIFDMDGVITHTMPDHYRAWKAILKREGIPITYYDIYSREGQKGLQSVVEIFQKYSQPISVKKARHLLAEKEKLFKDIVRVRFVPGMRQFLKGLARENFSLALVTGTSFHELKKILPVELRELFSVLVTGSDVHNGKPHPEPYLKCLKTLRVTRNDAIVIENAPLGIQSAKAAGLRCLALETSLPKKYLKEADRIFESVKHLRASVRFCDHKSHQRKNRP